MSFRRSTVEKSIEDVERRVPSLRDGFALHVIPFRDNGFVLCFVGRVKHAVFVCKSAQTEAMQFWDQSRFLGMCLPFPPLGLTLSQPHPKP